MVGGLVSKIDFSILLEKDFPDLIGLKCANANKQTLPTHSGKTFSPKLNKNIVLLPISDVSAFLTKCIWSLIPRSFLGKYITNIPNIQTEKLLSCVSHKGKFLPHTYSFNLCFPHDGFRLSFHVDNFLKAMLQHWIGKNLKYQMPWLECEQGYIVTTIRSENWIGALVNFKTWLRHTI